MTYLAQLNIADMRYPAHDPRMADFMNALGPVNALAERAPGFIWRLKDDSDNATGFQIFGRDDLLVNLSTWESVDALKAFVTAPQHLEIMRRRLEWFYPTKEASLVLWWSQSVVMPTVAEAEERLVRLRTDGPCEYAFNFDNPFL